MSREIIIGCIVAMVLGLVLCLLSSHAKYPILQKIFFWVGLVIAIIGLLIFLLRPLIWIAKQLSDATGVG